MADFDPSTATLTPPNGVPGSSFDPSTATLTPPAPVPRGALGEIGTGFARGALVDLPTMAGQALQYATTKGSPTNTFAQGLVSSAAARGQSPSLTLDNPALHNGLTNALASGAEQIAPMFAPIAAVGGAVTAAPFEVPAAAATLAGSVAGGALFAGQAGQDTLEKAQAKGVSPEAAQTASRLDAAATFATQVGLGMVGGKVLGVAGNALGKAVGTEAAPLAGQILDQMTGQAGIIQPFLKQTAVGAAEGVGLGATQAAASAGINNAYGIDDTSPLQAAKDSIVPMLGLTAVTAPFGLAGRALGARAAANRTALLGSADAAPEVRTALADQYANALEAGGTPETKAAADAFRENAKNAIAENQPLQVDGGLFERGAIQGPTYTPEGQRQMFGDGGAAPEAPVPVANTPQGDLFGGGGQQPAPDTTQPDLFEQPPTPELTGQQGNLNLGPSAPLLPAPEPIAGLLENNPTQRVTADGQVATNDQLNALGNDLQRSGRAQAGVDVAPAPEAAAPDGATKAPLLTQDEFTQASGGFGGDSLRAGLAYQDYLKDPALQEQLRPRAPNETKAAPEIASDIAAVNAANDFSTKPQAMVPLQKQLDTLGLDKMATHQDQIDALSARLDDPDAKIGSATRERMDALLNQWKSAQGAEDPVVAHEAPQLAGEAPADVAKLGENIPSPSADVTPAAAAPASDSYSRYMAATRGEVRLAATEMKRQLDAGEITPEEATRRIKAVAGDDGTYAPGVLTGDHKDIPAAEAAEQKMLADARARHAPIDKAMEEQGYTLSEVYGSKYRELSDNVENLTPAQIRKGLNEAAVEAKAAKDASMDQYMAHNVAAAGLKASDLTPQDHAEVRAMAEAQNMTNGQTQAELRARAAASKLEGRAPKQAKQLGENVPASVSTDAPAHTADIGTNVDQSPRSHAQETAGIVDKALKGFDARDAAGEKFTPLERERREDLQAFQRNLADINSGKSNNEAYTQSISEMAREAAQKPYTESMRSYKTNSPEATDPALMKEAMRTGQLNDTLGSIAKNSSTPEAAAYAKKLQGLGLKTTIGYDTPTDAQVAGEYHPDQNHVSVYPGGESEAVILHEATHAATGTNIDKAEADLAAGIKPRTQLEAQQQQATKTLQGIAAEAKARDTQGQYGFTNTKEFVAELNSNRDFQSFLKAASTNGKTLWQRTVDAVKKLLGMQTQGNYLERAMAAQGPLFEHTQTPNEAGFPLRAGTTMQKLFNKSPKDATTVTDAQYSKLSRLGDKAGAALDLSKIGHAVYRALAGWKTVQYLADRVRAIPALVESGFTRGSDGYIKAQESRKLAVAALEDPMTDYAQRTRRMLDKLGDSDKARDLSRQMATIAGEASRGGFDFRKNFVDNVKDGREPPAANKAYIDDIHRQFTQLQRTNPDAAKLIEEGERLNRKLLVTKVSTVARGLLDAAGGVAEKDKVRLQAEMARMAPDDAARAKQQTMLDTATGVAELGNKHALGLDFMDPALKSARNADAAKWHDGASSTLDGRLGALFEAAKELPAGTPLRSHLTELATLYGAQRNNPYFSLGRSGDYFVKVGFKNMDAATQAKLQDALKGTNKVLGNLLDGSDHAFFRVDTADQAMGLRAKLEAAGGDKIDQSKSAHGVLADKGMASATGVSPALRSLLDAVHTTVDSTGLSDDAAASLRDTITRQVLSMLPETSSRSATMQRRGIPGYDADFLGNYSRRANGGAQDNANLYTQAAFTQSQKQMSDAIQGLARSGNQDMQIRAQMTADEINRRYANSQKPIDNTTVNLLNSLGHTFYLAASPAYLIRTMAQPFHRALPIMGARYGFVSAAREVGGATGTAQKIWARTLIDGAKAGGLRGLLDANMSFKNMGLSPKEEAFVQELHDRGVLNLGQSRQLQQMAMGGTQRQQDLARMASMTAQGAEMSNRLATGLAAFRLAEKATGAAQRGTEANTEWAIQTIDRAMDNFEPSNTARQIGKHGFAGKVTPLLTAFMNYNLQTMQQISRTVHDGLFNQDQSAEGLQRSAEAKKEFAGLMATTFMISGAMGLPFANAFAGIYNTLTNDNDDPHDIRTDAQNFLDANLGHTLGGVVAHGIPHGAGFDSSTFGLENLLPGSEFLASRRLLKDRLDDSSKQLIGPALNAGLNLVDAADKFSDGYYTKGIEAALPSGLKPYFKAAELANHGYTDSKGNPIGITATPWDVGLQAGGFNSAKRATQIEASQFQGAREDRQKFAQAQISDKFYKGATTQDPDTLADAGSALAEYNTKNPTQPIRDEASGIKNRMMMLALAQASGTGVAVNRAAFPSLLHNLAYARDPDAAMPGY